MSLNRLEATADLSDPRARGLLHETLELQSNELRRLREELTAVRESERRVAPVPVESFPFPMGPVTSGSDIAVGMIVMAGALTAFQDYLPCDGAAVSRTTYATLFAEISTRFGAGDGSTTFNVPNMARRYPMGSGGSSANGVNNSVGSTGGSETSSALIAHTHTGPSHQHDLSNHTHDMQGHVHDLQNHTHGVTAYTVGGGATAGIAYGASGGAANVIASAAPNTNTTGANSGNTSVPSANITSAAGTGATGSAGSGSSFAILPPTTVVLYMIRYRRSAIDTLQSAPVAWGQVPGRAELNVSGGFPGAALAEAIETVVEGKPPEGVVHATAEAVAGVPVRTVTFKGLTRIPYNFRGFKTRGIRLRTKVNLTGAPVASSVQVQLKVLDPVTGSGYLSNTYTRTISVSAGTIADATYVDAKLTKDDLGPDWRAGYALQFELSFTLPTAHTTADLAVGGLLIDW